MPWAACGSWPYFSKVRVIIFNKNREEHCYCLSLTCVSRLFVQVIINLETPDLPSSLWPMSLPSGQFWLTGQRWMLGRRRPWMLTWSMAEMWSSMTFLVERMWIHSAINDIPCNEYHMCDDYTLTKLHYTQEAVDGIGNRERQPDYACARDVIRDSGHSAVNI
ncbi:hypothetical protein LAZ67_17000559 [Cordylochernes scorpioides]|uniref:Uncharacterized protein n=1 Tax=Cordylochernes scorpioides TaxID=51811 RepID=A0ABY6LCS7_9ARAC|nr:hypothetical protein LAZ67_17000559 [Cordylochernes scorpioides]